MQTCCIRPRCERFAQLRASINVLTGDEEIPVLLQGLAVLSDHVVQAQVQLVEGERLLRVGCGFSRRVVVGFLRRTNVDM